MKRYLPFMALAAACMAAPGRVLVLEDFENGAPAAKWSGDVAISRKVASHGVGSGEVRFRSRGDEIGVTGFAADWRGYDRLLFDVYSDRDAISTGTLRIYDETALGGKSRDYFDADRKVFVQRGWNHIEVKLPLRTRSLERELDHGRIRRIALLAGGAATLYLDNVRLAAGEEPAQAASRRRPADTATSIDGRFFTVRQVARAEDVSQSVEVTALRREAETEADLLRKAIEAARLQGIETIYEERHLVTADLGLRVRPRLAWYNNDEAKRAMYEYVARSCGQSRRALEDKIQGIDRLPEIDDTRVGEPLIPPFGPLKGRPIRGWFFVDDRGEPMPVISLHSPSRVLQRFFASPLQHIESYSVGGGSRWTVDESPVYKAFQEDPETHRAGWDGWCGHLVRDLDSMGGTKMDNTVICLESPRMRKAIEEYIRINIPKFNANPDLLYNILAYELMYICYCDRSQQMFREWLGRKHGTVEAANGKWGTSYKQFGEVAAPPVKNRQPLAGTNRGLWYDWARFNQDRFTDHLLWVRNLVHAIDPSIPLAAGGSSSMLSGHAGTSGIDEERIVNEVDDLIIHEGGGSTMGMDLQLAFSEKAKPLADPEMSLGSVKYLLPHVLHGKSVAQLWHWPAQPGNEFHSNNQTSLAHGWMYPLPDIGELLRASLDARRLNKEIAAFVGAPAQVAILYSQTSTLQLPPEMLTWNTTPYLAELGSTYEAAQPLDSRITFVTERKILRGWLDRYQLLLVPAARNLPQDVVEKIWDYAARGGHVLVTPESLVGDEYNRRAAYLSRLGIEVRETRRPKASGGRELVQGYDQSFSREVVFGGDTSTVLKAVRGGIGDTVKTQGIRQSIEAGPQAQRMFEYPEGGAAVVRVPLGKGWVYYCAAGLEKAGYSALLDFVFAESGVRRPVRVQPRSTDVEARYVESNGRRLLYVVNFGAQAVELRVAAERGFFRGLRELRAGTASDGDAITVGAGATNMYEMF